MFKVTEAEVTNKTYIFTTLEDYFGLNNPILQSGETTIKSDYIRQKRNDMSKAFRNMMFTSLYKRKQLSEEVDTKKTDKKYKSKKEKYIL